MTDWMLCVMQFIQEARKEVTSLGIKTNARADQKYQYTTC